MKQGIGVAINVKLVSNWDEIGLWAMVQTIKKYKWINGLDSLQQELKWRHTRKQLHTWVYLFSSLKPVDLCTVLYHQGAHKPSIGFGPASQLENSIFELSLVMYVCIKLVAGKIFNYWMSSTFPNQRRWTRKHCKKERQGKNRSTKPGLAKWKLCILEHCRLKRNLQIIAKSP